MNLICTTSVLNIDGASAYTESGPRPTSVPILINRPSDGGAGYWDQENDMSVGEGDIQLIFLDYFDYSQYPVKDFRFYRCKIYSS